MTDEDREDIIKKINTSGSGDNPDIDDFGDSIGGKEISGEQDGEPTDENVIHESGIEILPKDHKQVFVDAKLGVDETENKKMDNDLQVDENLSIFGEKNLKNLIMKKIHEMTETPVKEPIVIPTIRPNEQPTRRQKPWKINPNPNPEPKAEE